MRLLVSARLVPALAVPALAVPALAVALAGAAAPLRAQPALDSVVPASPAPRSFVADGGPVLDDAARARLDARIAAVQRATGGDVAVAIIRDLRGRAPQEVAVATYRAWGVGRVDSLGSARRDLGALLLIVPKELAPDGRGECFILTGRGAEGELLDSDAGRICRDAVIPHLRDRAYEAAIAAAVDSIGAAFAATTAGLDAPRAVGAAAGAAAADDGPDPRAVVGGAGAAVVALVGLLLGVRHRRRHRPRPCPRGCGPMARLDEAADDAYLTPGQRAEERVGSVDYDAWACARPGCDGHLVIPYARWWSSRQACPSCGYKTVSRTTRTISAATQLSTGLEEITLACANCAWRDVRRRETPRVPPPSSGGGSSGSGGGGGGGHSFGGSGATSGGGGGSSY